MYKVAKFEVTDEKILFDVIEKHPFATVITIFNGEPFVNHLPITIERTPDGKINLLGHMARRNPQWSHIKAGAPVMMSFQGPHTYVNSSWYEEDDVPTWNYIVVHASGPASLVESYQGLTDILKKTTDHMNHIYPDQWDFSLPWDLEAEDDLTAAIVGFQMRPIKLEGKFKLSQNRSTEDQKRVIAGLKNRPDEFSREIARWMEERT